MCTLLGFDAKLNIFRIRENKVQASFWFVGTKELRQKSTQIRDDGGGACLMAFALEVLMRGDVRNRMVSAQLSTLFCTFVNS